MPRRGAIIRARACRRDTITEVATLADAALAIERALGARLAEETITDRTRRTVRVDGALTEVDTAVSQALKTSLAISVSGALDRSLACTRDRFALLHRRAVRVARAPTRDDTAIVLAGLTHITICVDAAVADEDTLVIDALLVRGAVDVREALGGERLARSIDTLLTWEAVDVADALRCERDTLPVLAELIGLAVKVVEAGSCRFTDTTDTIETRATIDACAEVDALTAEVRADLVRSALVVRAAVTDEEAGVVQADFARVAVHISAAAERRDAVSVATDLIDAAVAIDAAFSLEDALTVDADLATTTVEVIEALGRIVHAAHVNAELVRRAIEVRAASGDRDTDSVLADLASGAVAISSAADELTLSANTRPTEATVSVDIALGDERTRAPEADEIIRAISGRRALTDVGAAPIVAEPALATVTVSATLGEAALTVIADGEADTRLRAIGVTEALFDVKDTLARITGRAIGALEVKGALPDLGAKPITADLTRATVEVLQTLAKLTDAVGTDREAAAKVGAIVIVEALHTDRQALTIEADVARATVTVCLASAWFDACLTIAYLPIRAVGVRAAFRAAFALDATLVVAAHRVIEAFGRHAGFADSISAEERPRHRIRIERVAVVIDAARWLGLHIRAHVSPRNHDVFASSCDARRPIRAVGISSADKRDRAVVSYADRSLTALGVSLAALAQGRSPTAL